MRDSVPQSSPKRVGELLLLAADYFKKRGRTSPRLDAEVLLAKVLGCDRIGVYLHFDETLPGAPLAEYRELIRRRGEGVPVAYLVGRKEFFSLSFRVTSDVLIPRPDTETLVETVLGKLESQGAESPKVLDLGCGSGSILLSLAHALKQGRFMGVDLSSKALDVAEENRRAICPDREVSFRRGDWFEALSEDDGPFDVVVSNPPYVRTADLKGLSEEIRKHEPVAALDGGPDGLDAYRKILEGLPDHLAPDGFVAFEIGWDQAESVTAQLEGAGFLSEVVKDLGGNDRVVVARRRDGEKETTAKET